LGKKAVLALSQWIRDFPLKEQAYINSFPGQVSFFGQGSFPLQKNPQRSIIIGSSRPCKNSGGRQPNVSFGSFDSIVISGHDQPFDRGQESVRPISGLIFAQDRPIKNGGRIGREVIRKRDGPDPTTVTERRKICYRNLQTAGEVDHPKTGKRQSSTFGHAISATPKGTRLRMKARPAFPLRSIG